MFLTKSTIKISLRIFLTWKWTIAQVPPTRTMLFLKSINQSMGEFPGLQPTTDRRKEGYINFFQDQTHAGGKKKGGYGRINFPICVFCVWYSPLPQRLHFKHPLILSAGDTRKESQNFPSFFFVEPFIPGLYFISVGGETR